MSTVTPSRPVPAREAPPRPRPPQRAAGFAGSIDPLRVLRRHQTGIILSVVIGVALGTGIFFLLNKYSRYYTGQVLFEVQPPLQESTDIARAEFTKDELVYRLATTESIILTSRGILKSAVNSPSIRETQWYKKFVDENGVFQIEEAVDELEDEVSADVVRGSNFFELTWTAPNALDVPIVLNQIANAYMTRRRSLDDNVYVENIEIFEEKLQETNNQIADLDQQIASFIVEKGITTLADPRYSQVALTLEQLTTQITTVNSSLNMALSERKNVAAKLSGTLEPSAQDVRIAEQNSAVQRHMSTLMNARTQLRYLRESYNEDHAQVRNAESRVRSLEDERDSKVQEVIKQNLEAQYKTLSDQIQNFRGLLDELEAQAEEKNQELRALAADQSQYEALRTRREHLELQRDADLQLIKEVELMRLRADASRIRKAQDAIKPREPSFPKVIVITPLVTLLIVALTIGVIFLRELTDHRIKSASDLAVVPHANVLGVIPDVGEDPTKIKSAEFAVTRSPQSVLAESYRQAWASVCRRMERYGHQTLLVLGGLPGAGSTTAITNIAATATAAGKRVVMVDSNLRRPRLAETVGLASEQAGLGDVLAGLAEIDDVITTVENGLSILPAGRHENRVFERLNDTQFDQVLNELRNRFDLVLLDSPPAVAAGDGMIIANKADATTLVVRANQEQRGLVARLINQIADARSELIGIILNRPIKTPGGYFKKNYETIAKYTPKA